MSENVQMTTYQVWTSLYSASLMYPIYPWCAIRQKRHINYPLEGAWGCLSHG